MNTLQILSTLNNLPVQSSGVYAANQIPKRWSRPSALVFNTDNSNQSGSHWVSIYVDHDGYGTFCDSFGQPPYIRQHIDAIGRNCSKFEWNSHQLQSETSDVCGHYCIMFLHLWSSGVNLDTFCSIFGKNLQSNDEIVREYYDNFLKNDPVSVGHRYCMQKCCSKIQC